MKYIIPLTLFILLSITGFAQSHRFADTTAQWYMTTYDNSAFCGGCISYNTQVFNVLGDTVIAAREYQKVNTALLRADTAHKVYLYYNAHETLIYDFSKNAADTFTLKNPWGGDMNAFCTVDSIDTLLVSPPRKRMYITLSGYGVYHDKWVDGIGSLYSDFLNPGIYAMSFDGPSYTLRCFYERDSLLLHTDSNDLRCDVDSTMIGILEAEIVSIYLFPNPSPSSFTITLSQQPQPNTALLIYNAVGALVKQEELTASTQQIDAAELPDGMYTYAILNNGIRQASGKLIVSH